MALITSKFNSYKYSICQLFSEYRRLILLHISAIRRAHFICKRPPVQVVSVEFNAQRESQVKHRVIKRGGIYQRGIVEVIILAPLGINKAQVEIRIGSVLETH